MQEQPELRGVVPYRENALAVAYSVDGRREDLLAEYIEAVEPRRVCIGMNRVAGPALKRADGGIEQRTLGAAGIRPRHIPLGDEEGLILNALVYDVRIEAVLLIGERIQHGAMVVPPPVVEVGVCVHKVHVDVRAGKGITKEPVCARNRYLYSDGDHVVAHLGEIFALELGLELRENAVLCRKVAALRVELDAAAVEPCAEETAEIGGVGLDGEIRLTEKVVLVDYLGHDERGIILVAEPRVRIHVVPELTHELLLQLLHALVEAVEGVFCRVDHICGSRNAVRSLIASVGEHIEIRIYSALLQTVYEVVEPFHAARIELACAAEPLSARK